MSKTIYILNGPNLNLLGKRETDIYGTATLENIESDCAKVGAEVGLSVKLMQSNHEGEIVEMIHDARDNAAGIIINPAAYSHTSVAISNIHKREEFRHHCCVSARAEGVIAGFGVNGYALAMRHMGVLLG